MTDPSRTFLYVGTYTVSLPHVQATAQGIYAFERTADGLMQAIDWYPSLPNPTFLDVHSEHNLLFACSEVDDMEEFGGGGVSAHTFDPETGALTMVDRHASGGEWPCHVTLDEARSRISLANYKSGSLQTLPYGNDGRFVEGAFNVQHEGSSVDQERQEGPHAHSTTLDPSGTFLIACDLGMDRARVYELDGADGPLTHRSDLVVRPGSGPRHFDFHPNGRWAYVLNELSATIDVCNWDGDAGTLTSIQTINTLPADWDGHVSTADIHVHPSGKWAYNSNRGHDSITIFAVDATDGTLTLLGHESTRGKTPRNFALSPEGDRLYAANQDSDTIVVFALDQETGLLSATGEVIDAPTPVCLKFVLR